MDSLLKAAKMCSTECTTKLSNYDIFTKYLYVDYNKFDNGISSKIITNLLKDNNSRLSNLSNTKFRDVLRLHTALLNENIGVCETKNINLGSVCKASVDYIFNITVDYTLNDKYTLFMLYYNITNEEYNNIVNTTLDYLIDLVTTEYFCIIEIYQNDINIYINELGDNEYKSLLDNVERIKECIYNDNNIRRYDTAKYESMLAYIKDNYESYKKLSCDARKLLLVISSYYIFNNYHIILNESENTIQELSRYNMGNEFIFNIDDMNSYITNMFWVEEYIDNYEKDIMLNLSLSHIKVNAKETVYNVWNLINNVSVTLKEDNNLIKELSNII